MPNAFYQTILDRPLLQTAGVSYLSCRGPDGRPVLLAQCRDDALERSFESLRQREQEIRTASNLASTSCDFAKSCSGLRNCRSMSFLPKLCREENMPNHTYALEYECFNFAKMVKVYDLANWYFISQLTAYRLAASLLTLINWLLRMRILVHLSITNLLVDLDSSFCVPIDWSIAKVREFLPTPLTIYYYRQFARIILRLTGAKITDGHWALPAGSELEANQAFFKLLQKTARQTYELPEDVIPAMDYVTKLRNQQKNLLRKIYETLSDEELKQGQPRYSLYPRKIKEG